jgi:hypothetical protein
MLRKNNTTELTINHFPAIMITSVREAVAIH